MKLLTIILVMALCFSGCKNSDMCSTNVKETLPDGRIIGFMIHGGMREKYLPYELYTLENVDPYDWDNNKYFTGKGWSDHKNQAMKAADSCLIKATYVKWKNR